MSAGFSKEKAGIPRGTFCRSKVLWKAVSRDIQTLVSLEEAEAVQWDHDMRVSSEEELPKFTDCALAHCVAFPAALGMPSYLVFFLNILPYESIMSFHMKPDSLVRNQMGMWFVRSAVFGSPKTTLD